jgi:hypothetical protein
MPEGPNRFEWMKYLHGVLHGNNMDDVLWSSKYGIGSIENRGGGGGLTKN